MNFGGPGNTNRLIGWETQEGEYFMLGRALEQGMRSKQEKKRFDGRPLSYGKG